MERNLQGLVRLIDKRTAGPRATTESMVEWSASSGVTGAAGEGPTCTIDGDDSADVLEPYGVACSAPAGEALVLALGGDVDNLVALVSSVPGRPATDTGDVALWTVGGHEIYLDDDGGVTITSKDGAVITISVGGSVVVEVPGGQTIKLGDATATQGVARLADSVGPSAAMAAWGLVIETFINGLVPGTFTPANSFVGTVQNSFGTITDASATTLSK